MTTPSRLDACFDGPRNELRNQPTAALVEGAPIGAKFEQRAFAALFRNSKELGIASLWKCRAARMDGYIITTVKECILLEMKESLRWGSTQAATFQFLAGRKLLNLEAKRAIIVFERWSDEWSLTTPYGAWGQLALHAEEVSEYISIGAMQITATGKIVIPPKRAV